MPSSSSKTRILFLDWLRGLAAVTMLQGHTFDSFLRPQARTGAAFMFSQFFGGQAAAIFLFLTGVTYALGMNRCEQLPPWQRVRAALRRARYLFILAILFRLQTWLFAWPHSSWTDLLRVDVLNTMGASAALLAAIALQRGIQRVRVALVAGVTLAALAPVISSFDTHGVPAALRNYFVPSYDFFSIFPWGSFLAFGVAAGSVIPFIERGGWNRVMQWTALAGFGLVLGGQYFSNLPFSIYPKSEFWLNSPALVACKLGVTLLLASAAFLWTGYLSVGWSWVRQLGTTSLAVYWLHVELVYGRWFALYRARLEVWECAAAAVALTIAMVGLSVALTRVPWRQFWKILQPGSAAKPAVLQPVGFRTGYRGAALESSRYDRAS
jgi:hypothetical protein